jgi:hypothetical protein
MKIFLLLGMFFLTCVGLCGAYEAFIMIIAKSDVKIISVEIVKAPSICISKHNRISVKIKNKEYSIEISKNECVSKEFSIGQKLEVKYSQKYDILIPRHGNDLFVFFLTIMATFFSGYVGYRCFKETFWVKHRSIQKK